MLDWISTHIPAWVWIGLIAHFTILGTVAYLILLERKTASWVQDRIGPNRVGFDFGILPIKFHFWGLGQPLADGLKFIVKEDYKPKGVDTVLFTIAPGIMIVVIIISIATLPWGGIKQGTVTGLAPTGTMVTADNAADYAPVPAGAAVTTVSTSPTADGKTAVQATYRYPFQIANLNIGVLYILASLSLAVYGVVIGGWASNNKYSFLGGLRATANMISYEVPLGLAILSIVVMYGTLDLGTIVDKQAGYWLGVIPSWNVFSQPLAFMMFLICIHAEANRAPFDTAEAEQELVGGYHTEYSAMRFALFFLAEYAGMITTSAVCVALFFGGWHLPYVEWVWPALQGVVDPNSHAVTDSLLACIVRGGVFFGKTVGIIFIFMWVRWSLPRFRFDQIMNLAWRALIPISLLQLMTTAFVVYMWGGHARDHMRVSVTMALMLLITNFLALAIVVIASVLLPPPADTNRKIRVVNSRFNRKPALAVPVAVG